MEQLTGEGWTKKFTAREPQLSEYVKMYESLGFEVYLQSLEVDEKGDQCRECFKTGGDQYKAIYTRKK
ncbi:MAG TPA: hypothetical protein DCM26_02165 [Desulfotomaculum sp.]|jgi:hypothetical protein|nr:hypothetical protein [Desulfotomaculum sp.]